MKKGDIIICHKTYKKYGVEFLTKGKKYHINMNDYNYNYDERIRVTSTTNRDWRVLEFYLENPSLIERIKRRIQVYIKKLLSDKPPIAHEHAKEYPVCNKYFSDYFYTEKDIRKLKLKKLNRKNLIYEKK